MNFHIFLHFNYFLPLSPPSPCPSPLLFLYLLLPLPLWGKVALFCMPVVCVFSELTLSLNTQHCLYLNVIFLDSTDFKFGEHRNRPYSWKLLPSGMSLVQHTKYAL